MKITLIIGLLMVLTTHLVGPLLVSGWFYAQQSSLAEQFCENRDRPELHCDGQCFLAQKLAAYYTADAGSHAPEPIPTFLPLGWPEEVTSILSASAEPAHALQPPLRWPDPLEQRIFHPPRLS